MPENENGIKSAELPAAYRWVYSHTALCAFLKGADIASVILVAVAYAAGLAYALVCSPLLFAELLALTFVPFVCVSLIRKKINAPRPYELYDFAAVGLPSPGKKSGSSFPSRHVFSAFLIGSLFCFFCPAVGAAVLALGALLALCRAVLGVHFVRDVVSGALLGAVLGVVAGLIIILI